MEKKSIKNLILDDNYSLFACILIVICVILTKFTGSVKIISILPFLSLVLLIVDFVKSKLYKDPIMIIRYFVISCAAVALLYYHLLY